MSGSTPTSELDRLFRQAYQAVVDRTEMPGDTLPVTPLTRRPRGLRRGPLVAMAVAAVVLGFGGLALLTSDPYQFAGKVERLALVKPVPGLGGEPVIEFADDGGSEDFAPMPPAQMWIWAADDGDGPSVALFEVEIGTDVSDLIGRAENEEPLVAPGPDEVTQAILPEFGWHASSWITEDRWRIAVGFDEGEVFRMAEVIGDQDPSTVDLGGRELAYEGEQVLRAPVGASTPAILYDSPAGQFGVAVAHGWPELGTIIPLSSDDVTEAEVNGVPATDIHCLRTASTPP